MVPYGKYIKVTIKGLTSDIYSQLKTKPTIVTQVAVGEQQRGFLMVKMLRHKFYTAILKSNDPLIVSVGFHKYQTIPYFCRKDTDERLRFVKYTPKYEFCIAIFYGNFAPNGTGVVAFQTLNEEVKKFRVAATGVVIGFA